MFEVSTDVTIKNVLFWDRKIFLGNRERPMNVADSLSAIYEPTV
jgi:hypothetical protein